MLLSKTGKALIHHTYDSAKEAIDLNNGLMSVHVVTDSLEIADYCRDNEIYYIRSGHYNNGSSRILNTAKLMFPGYNVINVQGDCPNISAELIQFINRTLQFNINADVVTSHYSVKAEENIHQNPSKVKSVMDKSNNVLYYSREPIPHNSKTYDIHIGVYGFSSAAVDKCLNAKQDAFTGENLEQLNWLYSGLDIISLRSQLRLSSIDTQEDYDAFVRAYTK